MKSPDQDLINLWASAQSLSSQISAKRGTIRLLQDQVREMERELISRRREWELQAIAKASEEGKIKRIGRISTSNKVEVSATVAQAAFKSHFKELDQEAQINLLREMGIEL